MTRTLGRDETAAGGAPLYRVREERDRQILLGILTADPGYAAFAIGHLDRKLFEDASYWTAEGPDGQQAVVMHSSSAVGRMSALVGDPAGVGAVLSLHPGPRGGYLGTCAPEHLTIAQNVYALDGLLTMIRMTVDADSFAATAGAVRRLVGGDARALNALYASGGGPTGYRREHIEQGVYRGVFEQGELVAVAGTHLVTPSMGVAVVGNVFTHAAWRGRGLAKQATSAVTAELLERGCWLVALTVDPDNTPAVRAYERLGYARGAPVHEVRYRRRDVLGLGAALRRRFAHRSPDREQLVHARVPLEDD